MSHHTAAARVLLCFSEIPAAQAVIRAAAHLATDRRAELYALHVERPGASTRRAPATAAQLAANQRFARDLGAQVTIVQSHRVAEAILAFAREHAIDLIVLGQSNRAGWKRLIGDNVVKRVVEGSGGVAVEVIER